MSDPLHTLLLHVPKLDAQYGPVGAADAIHMMAVGLPALAEVVENTGRAAQVVHLGVERRVDPSFDLRTFLQRRKPRVIGLSLHWHPQTYHTVQAARQVKEALPDAFVVLGGFTATAFHDQIVAEEKAVDAVIRGDGEKPLLDLVHALDHSSPLSNVPNLTYRASGEVRQTPQSYTATADALSQLGFERFDLVSHARQYIRDCGLHYVPHNRNLHRMMRLAQSVFGGSGRFMVLPAGRGCSVNCAWCGGGFGVHRRWHGRKGPIQLHSGRLAALVARSVELGFRGVHACFDPHPNDPAHWVDVFDRVRRSDVRTGILFESFRLPHPALAAALGRTFRRPVVAISPESPREDVRHKVRGLPFSNDELLGAVEHCAAAGVDVLLSFGLGLPGETEGAIDEAVALHARCVAVARKARRGSRVLLRTFPIEMEPGAPWSEPGGRWGVVPSRNSFLDYVKAHTPGHTGPEAGLGYYQDGYFDKRPSAFAEALRERACEKMCPLPPGPRWGHRTCAALRRARGAEVGPCTA